MLDPTLTKLIDNAVDQKADAIAIFSGRLNAFSAVHFNKMQSLGDPTKAEAIAVLTSTSTAGAPHEADPTKRLIKKNLPAALSHIIVSRPWENVALLKLAYAESHPATPPRISTPELTTEDERARYTALAGIPEAPIRSRYTESKPCIISRGRLIQIAKDIGAKRSAIKLKHDAPETIRTWALPTHKDYVKAAKAILYANKANSSSRLLSAIPVVDHDDLPGSRLYAFAASTKEGVVEAVACAHIYQTFRPLENVIQHGVDQYTLHLLDGAPKEGLVVAATAFFQYQMRWDFYRLACQLADHGAEVALDTLQNQQVSNDHFSKEWIKRSHDHIAHAIKKAKMDYPVFDGKRRDVATAKPRHITKNPDNIREIVACHRAQIETDPCRNDASVELAPENALAVADLYALTFDCRSCGACCQQAGLVLLDDSKINIVPKPYNRSVRGVKNLDSHDHKAGRQYLSNTKTGACRALFGTAGDSVSCNIYSNRPQVCSDFTPGNERCLSSREKAGIPMSHGRLGQLSDLKKLDKIRLPRAV